MGEVDPALDVQSNPVAMGDLEEKTAHTTGESGLESTLVAKGDVEQAEGKVGKARPTAGSNLVEPRVSAKGPPPATSRPKRVIRPPLRYGDWELNTISSSGYPMALKNKVESIKVFLQEQKNLKSDYMQNRKQGRSET